MCLETARDPGGRNPGGRNPGRRNPGVANTGNGKHCYLDASHRAETGAETGADTGVEAKGRPAQPRCVALSRL